MKPARPSRWGPILTAFTIWFLHFMLCWAASELVWPHRWPANALAWVATAAALPALGLHALRLRARHAAGQLPGWDYRFALGAVALATAAVLFSVLPSVVFLP